MHRERESDFHSSWLKVHSHYAFFAFFASKAKNGFYTHSLHLRQHPIDTMLQFDANANVHANVAASVNGPLVFKENSGKNQRNFLAFEFAFS